MPVYLKRPLIDQIRLPETHGTAVPRLIPEGDLIVWDNRCTMHRARPFEEMSERRVLHRTTISDEMNTVERMERNAA